MRHYLDYNATAPLRPEVIERVKELHLIPLNSSSVHSAGRKAKSIIEDSRRLLAETINAFANEIIFTASGTEANNWVLNSFRQIPLIVSAIEHSSVLKPAQSFAATKILPVTSEGAVDIDALEALLPQKGEFLVSVMLANNETGVVQPVKEIADIVHARGALLHCDAVQAFGKIPVSFTDLGCDMMTLSAHKMGGPVGAAMLVVRNGLAIKPMLTGGGQEFNRRAGTENVPAIAGFAKAAELIDLGHMKELRSWLDALEKDIGAGQGNIIGTDAARLPNTACITMPGVNAETQLISFDLEGISVSAGSACSSGRVEPSHVLKAMGISDKEANTAIRISGGWGTTHKDIDRLAAVWKKLFHSKNSPMQ